MAEKNEARIRTVHEKLMQEFVRQISESIRDIHHPADDNRSEVRKNGPGFGPEIKEVTARPQEEHAGPDKVNEIRSEVASAQSAEILNPDKQSELMEIVKQKSEKFERKLRRMPSLDKKTIESARQKFECDLMDNVRKQLTEKKNTLAHS
jgi:hypothetical protein